MCIVFRRRIRECIDFETIIRDPTSDLPRGPGTICVSVPSYRDYECSETLYNLFSKADNPERVFVYVFEQNCLSSELTNEKEDCIPKSLKFKHFEETNIQRVTIPSKQAKGPLYARQHIFDMYQGEEYCLMIDSHSDFDQHWDTYMINELTYLRNEKGIDKPILSSYPHEQIVDADNDNTTLICGVTETSHGLPGSLLAYQVDSGKYYKTMLLGAGFLFTFGEFAKICSEGLSKVSLTHIFNGEEILLAIIAYTNGWDIYAPPYMNVYHSYGREGEPDWFSDNSGEDLNTGQLDSLDKLKEIVSSDCIDKSNCVFGILMNVTDFWKEFGFNLHPEGENVSRLLSGRNGKQMVFQR